MTLADLLAGALALILASGAGAKLLARDDFALAVDAYELLPERAVPTFARLFPAAELLAALLLLVPATRMAGAALGIAVIAGATAGVVVNLLRGRVLLDCGCGGLSGRQPISWWLVARNGGLVVLALVAGVGGAVTLDPVSGIAGAVVLALAYAALGQLLANGLRLRKVTG